MNEYQREPIGYVDCTGEAHRNAFIDHCAVCLGGEWGRMLEYAPVDFERARREHLDVPFPIMSDAECQRALDFCNEGFADAVEIRRGGAWYSVLRWRREDGDE